MRTPRIIACSIIASGALLLPTAASAAPPATTAPPRLQEAAFTSPQRGYGLFDQVGAKMCRAEVAVTAIGQAELVRTSKATGYVLTGPDVNPRGKPDAAKILITRNGGRFWSRHAVQCGLDGQTAALAVAPTGEIFVACASEPGAGSQAKTLASSPNGSTWTVRSPCAHGTMFCPPLSVGYLGQIAATSNSTVFLVGPRSSLLVTHNAGRTWHAVKPMIGDSGGGTSSVVFFGRRGIVVGNDPANNELPAIWHTTDGGTHWHLVQ